MPTVLDATIVNQAYDTSGNGGRKLVRLSNGWLVSVLKSTGTTNAGTNYWFYVHKGTSWELLTTYTPSNPWLGDISIVAKGTFVHMVFTYSTDRIYHLKFDATTVGASFSGVVLIDSGQTALGNVSLAINEAGTELHAAWASKNSTYPNSFNIRYAKGTINGDGSVTWSAVEQISVANAIGIDIKNPSITLNANRKPIILADYTSASLFGIGCYYYDGSVWQRSNNSYAGVYNSASYAQSSPSACVDKNGRIWVAWYGLDATDTAVANIRVAYSDDGGATWSSMVKLTSGNSYSQDRPSITANRNNEIFIVWHGRDASDVRADIRMIKYSSGSWGSIAVVAAGTTNDKAHASTLYDTTLDFSTPLFIYQDFQGNKVGFYGTWVVTTISVQPGSLGQKTSADKTNLLSYNITTDGTMSDITEKVNGTVVNTRTSPPSGQQFTVSLTQEQWDEIKYGKYKDATGGLNTLTIEMGSEKWEYTFDKRLATDSDVLSAVKAVQDSQTTFLPAVKAKLAGAIRGKGGTVNDTDSWDVMVSAVVGMTNKRWATGSLVGKTGTISSLSFRPKFVLISHDKDATYMFVLLYNEYFFDANTASLLSKNVMPASKNGSSTTGTAIVSPITISSNGFSFDYGSFGDAARTTNWLALE